jgi:hypothetical protein
VAPAVSRDGDALVLALHVQPRARADAVVGVHGDRIKVRLAAAPVDGAANAALLRFLAAEFGVTRSEVRLIAGASARAKTVRIVQPRRQPVWLAAIVPGIALPGPAA